MEAHIYVLVSIKIESYGNRSVCVFKDRCISENFAKLKGKVIFFVVLFIHQDVKESLLKGVANGLPKFCSARKIWPLLDLLAKFRRLLACSCSQNYRSCLHARIPLKFAQLLEIS